jgi:rubrerythrin
VPNVRRWKLECLNALRPAVYLGAGLVEAWDTAAEGARGKKARQETLKRVLKNAKTFVRDLSSEVLRAKELWAEDDFANDAELVYAAHTLHRLNELKVVAEAEQERGLEAKRKLIREAKRFQGVWCRACRHKCMDQQATHCPTCGVRFTSKGVIAVGDIGSENFQEQTRESRASLADRLAERASLESRPGPAGLIEAPAEEVQPQPSVTFSLETDESTNPLQRSSIESSYTYGSESVSQE